MTFLVKILKKLMRSTQEIVAMSFIQKLCHFECKTGNKLEKIRRYPSMWQALERKMQSLE
jgi:hypothetical protein